MTPKNPPKDDKISHGDKVKFERTVAVHAGTEIDPQTQKDLNTPFSDQGSKLSKEEKEFLENLIRKVNAGEINLLQPSSVINQEVYGKLKGEDQSRTEQFISAMLSTMRQIMDYYNNPHSNDSYQMINLLSDLRRKIEILEKEIGDVLKI